MKKLLFLIILFLSTITSVVGQSTVNISGIVTDINSQPIPGVSVFIDGSPKGASTDFDGKYLISDVPKGVITIVASYIGYKLIRNQIDVSSSDIIKNFVLKEDLLSLNEIIVTGSSNPKTKIESSIAITTLNAKAIENKAPMSTGDLLQSVPGFLVETSGGEVGNNLFARGIPSTGAYEYVQIQEDGLPVFEDGALQFANIDNFQRVDLTLKTLEAVKGGSASIFSSGAPGGVINFISKTGQNEFKGTTKLTVGDYGLFRTDFNLGGSIVVDKLLFNVGGFYRVDEGIRSPGFDANKGGQVKMNFTYKYDKGYVRIHYKYLNDKNIFLLPIPLKSDSNGDPTEFSGFNANYGTLTSRNFSRLRVPQAGGSYYERDLENGVHPISDAIGGEFKYDISENITIKNSFRNTKIDLTYDAIFSTGGPNNQVDFATGTTQFPITESANIKYTYVDNGMILAPTALIMRADHWAIDKKMDNFVNDLKFMFNLDKMNFTLGYYISNWKSNQYWNWSNYLVDVSDNPRLVNLVDTSTGVFRTWNGVERITWLERDAQTKGKVNALYLDGELEFNKILTLNFGLRYDDDKYSGYRDNARFFSTDLGHFDNNTADNAVTVVTGNPYTYWRYDVDELSYTTALNYKFNDHTAIYGRYSHGFRSPIEETYYDNASNLSEIKTTGVNQVELGFKYSNRNFAVFANLFHMNLTNIPFNDILADGSSEGDFADVTNIGLEFEANAKLGVFSIETSITLQNPEYKNFTATDGSFDYTGNTARRIPKIYYTIRPNVEVTKRFDIYGQLSYFGKKFTNQDNAVVLPAFSVFNAGTSYEYKNLRFALDASNLFNSIGLTEGNPRRTTSAADDVFLARPILGRAIKLSVAIDF